MVQGCGVSTDSGIGITSVMFQLVINHLLLFSITLCIYLYLKNVTHVIWINKLKINKNGCVQRNLSVRKFGSYLHFCDRF